MKILRLALAGLLLISSVMGVSAAPLISEFMASNDTGLIDEDGDFSDWIEIHNPDADAVDLAGMHLTDDASQLDQWEIPAVSIPAGGYLVVYASNKNRADSAQELHTNFKLSSSGGYLALVAVDGTTVLSEFGPVYSTQFEDQSYGVGRFGGVTQEALVVRGSGVTYLIPTDDSLESSWADTNFDDDSWAVGTSGIGYESNGGTLEPSVTTNIAAEMRGENTSGYFRFAFNYSSVGKQLQSLQLEVIIDDGFVAYLNGQEIGSHYAPTPIEWDSNATDFDSDTFVLNNPSVHTITVTPGILNDGVNVLAIQGLNRELSSSDFLLMPELKAEVLDTSGQSHIGYFQTPTPGAANSSGKAAGPVFIDVTGQTERPVSGTDLVITASVAEVVAPLSSITMFYRVMFDAESEVEMRDNGAGPDLVAGDGIYSASISGGNFEAGEMIRWRFLASDQYGIETKLPSFREPLDSHEYIGTVAVDPAVNSLLPVVETFLQNPNAAKTDNGTRGAVFYLGELYDNIFMNQHGQSTAEYLFIKKSFNLDFNKTQRFLWNPDEKRVKDIDMITNFADKSKARHVLAWEVMREAGVNAHFAYTIRVQQNGEFWGTLDFIEDPDDIYLERVGLNPEGALYKMYDVRLESIDIPKLTSDDSLDASGNTTTNRAAEKKNRRTENRDDLRTFITGLQAGNTDDQGAFIYDNVNLPMMVNLAAVYCITRNTDVHRKNWYFYCDTGRTDEWAMLPWDLDLSHGRSYNSTDYYFNTGLDTDSLIEVGSQIDLIDLMWDRTEVREMMRRRIRTLADRFLNHNDTPYAERYYERRLDEMLAQIDPPSITPSDARLDFEKWGSWIDAGHTTNGDTTSGTSLVSYANSHSDVETMQEAVDRFKNEYLVGRRTFIDSQSTIPAGQTGMGAVTTNPLVSAEDAVRVKVPIDASEDATWMMSDFDDSSWTAGVTGIGFDSFDYLPLIGLDTNDEMRFGGKASAYMRIDFQVEDPAAYLGLRLQMKFDDGYIAYLNGVEIHSQFAPDAPSWESDATGSHESSVDDYEIFDVSAFAGELVSGTNVLAIHGMNDTTGSRDFLIMPELLGLIGSLEPVIEFGAIDFSPASGNQDGEFFELINNNDLAVDVSDWSISGGVDFKLAPGTVIPANSSLYVSPNVTTFRERTVSPKGGEFRYVVGPYSGHLSSFGESLALHDAAGVLNNSGSYVGEPSDIQQSLVITEIMYHPEPNGSAEYIELMNISDSVTLDLTGVNFTKGITFDFTGGGVTSLAPGARVLIVRDLSAFEATYGSGLPVAGVFSLSSRLSNEGESIKLEDSEGGTVKEFSYDDKAPWPINPATGGFSLVLITPGTNPDPSEPSNWRASIAIGGTPSGTDAVTYSGDPTADLDNDGLSALVEYAVGSSDSDANSGVGVISIGTVEHLGSSYTTFSYQWNPAAEDVMLMVETSIDLAGWSDATAGMEQVSRTTNGDGSMTTVMRMATPVENELTRYFRLKVDLF